MKGKHHISLKVPAYEDYSAFYDARFRDEVMYWADDVPHPLSLDEYPGGRMLAQATGVILERIILLDGEPIGTVTGREFSPQHQCTLGVVIAREAAWGHGYGYEAIRMFLNVLALEGVSSVVLETYANNYRAQRCFYKLGFQKKRVYFSPVSGRFVIQMSHHLSAVRPIGEVIGPDDPRWRPPRRTEG